jgi:glutathione S-transferase
MSAASGFFWTGWATLAALGVYFWTLMNVGRGRGKFQVKAPSMDGPPAFLSMVRVQANTVEQLVLFLPALWLCALFRGDLIAAALGAVWVIGRIAYAVGYYRAPTKRGPGFVIAMAATACLVIATVLGLVGQLR